MKILLGVLLVVLAAAALDIRLRVRRYTDSSCNITKAVRAVLISDLHCCLFGKNQGYLIRKVEEQDPDMVFFAGDMIDRRYSPENALLLMKQLGEKFPCYYVEGNHERIRPVKEASGNVDLPELKNLIRGCGVTVLDGESCVANVNGQHVFLSGAQDIAIGTDEWRAQLSACAAAREEGCYSILLVHRPGFCQEFENLGFDLILCGHTHGGQVRIPFLLNGLFCPDEWWFPKYAGGEYRVGASKMIVSRGLMLRLVPRIFNPPEIVVVDIQPEREQPTD